jgi:hypothetical protein
MTKYTLEELAWLSRCLFPVKFYEDMLEMGVDRQDAYNLSAMSHPNGGRAKNIIDVYQGCLCFVEDDYREKQIAVLHQYIDNFLKKD